jgi:serine phosphatase RsbU (regulator of sigma subunit)
VLRWTSLDSLIAALAALGVLALLLLVPRLHPDAAADASLTPGGAEDAARSAAQRLGYDVRGWQAEAMPHRADDLLDTLQLHLGRAQTLALLRDAGAAEVLPAYGWRVELEPPDEEDPANVTVSVGGVTEGVSDLSVLLTRSGVPWDVRVIEDDAPTFVDADAIRAAHDQPIADSTFDRIASGRLDLTFAFLEDAFDPTSAGADSSDQTPTGLPGALSSTPDGASSSVRFGRGEAARMAEHHAARLPFWSELERTRPDSLSLEGDLARLHVWGEVRSAPVRLEIDVAPTGRLAGLDTDFSPGSHDDSVGFIVFAVGSGAVYVLLALTLLVYFARRLMARTVDIRSALLDGLAAGLPLALFVTLTVLAAPDEDGAPLLLALLLILPFMLLISVLGFTILAASVEGPSREAWPEKLRASTLLRRASLLNARVGFAFVRGTLAGVALAGLSALLLLVPVPLRLTEDIGILVSAFPVRGLIPFLLAAPIAYGVLASTLLGVGSFLRRTGVRIGLLVVGVSVVQTLLGPLTFAVNPPWLTWIVSLPTAALLVLLFLRYDFLTAFCAAFFASVVWMGAHYAELGGFAPTVDAAVIGVVTLGALVLGAVGIRSGRTGDEEADYVPAYVAEMAQQERMRQELEFARQVQAAFLPRVMPDVPGVDTAALCIAASEVGGDYYDLMPLEGGRLGVAIGDVSGKGIQAAFYMTLVKGFLRSLVRRHDSPADVLRELNVLFRENVPRGTFISMIYGVLDPATGTFTFARAGHNPLILRRASRPPGEAGALELAQPRGVGIGFLPAHGFDPRIEEQTLVLGAGDSVTLYTDGFSEAMNASRALYGDERLAAQVGQLGARTASEIVGGVATDVQHFTGSAAQHDDMTMVVVRMAPPRSAQAD